MQQGFAFSNAKNYRPIRLAFNAQIGTVFASEEYVCPNAVGVDIGCGMCAVPIDGLHRDDLSLDDKLRIQQLIKVQCCSFLSLPAVPKF